MSQAGTYTDYTIGTLNNNFLFAYDDTKQTIVTPGTFQQITIANNGILNGWTHTTPTGNLVCNQSGVYLINYMATAAEDMSGADSTIVTRALNDAVEIAGSRAVSYIEVGSTDDPHNMKTSFLASIDSGDTITFEFTGNAPDALITLASVGAPYSAPSFAVTITRIQ